MRAGEGKVSAIVEDERTLVKYAKKRYLVYIENEDGNVLWKAIDEMPCVIEFDLSF
jgi:hypothetical protein